MPLVNVFCCCRDDRDIDYDEARSMTVLGDEAKMYEHTHLYLFRNVVLIILLIYFLCCSLAFVRDFLVTTGEDPSKSDKDEKLMKRYVVVCGGDCVYS